MLYLGKLQQEEFVGFFLADPRDRYTVSIGRACTRVWVKVGDVLFLASSVGVIGVGIIAFAVGFVAGELFLGSHQLLRVAPHHFYVHSADMRSL